MVLGNVGGGEAVILGKARIYAENKHAETEQPETGNNERVTGDGGAGEPKPELELAGARNHYPGGMKVAVFPFIPTSERLAEWLWRLADSQLNDGRVAVSYGRIYETLHPVESVAEYAP